MRSGVPPSLRRRESSRLEFANVALAWWSSTVRPGARAPSPAFECSMGSRNRLHPQENIHDR
jgi:hypothetical protein